MHLPTRPKWFVYKKFAVFVMIGITAALLTLNTVYFVQSRYGSHCESYNVGHFASFTDLGANWLIASRFLALLLLAVESYFVYREHYHGCVALLIFQHFLSIWTILLGFKIWVWYVWIMNLFDQLHNWALALYWKDLNEMRTEVWLAAARRAVAGQAPLIKVVIQREGTAGTGRVMVTVTATTGTASSGTANSGTANSGTANSGTATTGADTSISSK